MFLLEVSGFVILPLIVLVAISLIYEPAYVVGRYDLIAYPAFLLLTAGMFHILAGKQAMPFNWTNAAVITLFVLLIGVAATRDIEYLPPQCDRRDSGRARLQRFLACPQGHRTF